MKNVYRIFAVLVVLLFVVVVCAYAAETAPGVVILKGAPMGGVKFDHKAHVAAGAKCETCHHASKPEKALASPHQKCTDCHTNPVAAGMKTKAQAAFHNPAATAGVCIYCHKTEAAKAKNAPTKCTECHKKENA